jgi:hypothetical protein
MMPEDELENFPTSEPKKMGWPALSIATQAAFRVGISTLMYVMERPPTMFPRRSTVMSERGACRGSLTNDTCLATVSDVTRKLAL